MTNKAIHYPALLPKSQASPNLSAFHACLLTDFLQYHHYPCPISK